MLLVSSFKGFHPDLLLVLLLPNPPTVFLKWCRARHPDVVVVEWDANTVTGWSTKPFVISRVFEYGFDQVVWIDADLLFLRGIAGRWLESSPEVLVIADNNPTRGTSARVSYWGIEPKRLFAYTINSSVIRMTASHTGLLEEWCHCLAGEKYQTAQSIPLRLRPLYARGDQDVLEALLCSSKHAAIQVDFVESGSEILHCTNGSFCRPRFLLRCLFRAPAILHAHARKPWERGDKVRYWRDLGTEVSPYLFAAKRYRQVLGAAAHWQSPTSGIGWWLSCLAAISFYLPALVLTVLRRLRPGLYPD